MTRYLRAKRTYNLLLLNGYRFVDGCWVQDPKVIAQAQIERKVHAASH